MQKSNHLLLSSDDFIRQDAGYRLTEKGICRVAHQKMAALKRYATGMVGSHWADDIVQNIFVKLLKQDFREASAGVVMVWMFRVAHNEAFDLMRAQGRLTNPESIPETPVQPESNNWENRQHIDNIFSLLTPMEKDCFNMIHQGYSYKEVGKSLSISEDHVAVVVHRARKKIVRLEHETA